MVLANDADSARSYMLVSPRWHSASRVTGGRQVHQLKRLGTPTFLVTTHEAQNMPRIWVRTAQCCNGLRCALLLYW